MEVYFETHATERPSLYTHDLHTKSTTHDIVSSDFWAPLLTESLTSSGELKEYIVRSETL